MSPDQPDQALGAKTDWPPEICVLLLDAFPPARRADLLRRAFGHRKHVWVIRLAVPCEASQRDRALLQERLKANIFARLKRGSLVVHAVNAWSEAQFDPCPSGNAVEIWRLGQDSGHSSFTVPQVFQQALGTWDARREDFHWPLDEHPEAWQHYRASQQDSIQDSWPGPVAAIDGSVDRRNELMGAGAVVGCAREPAASLSFPVGGPLSSLRAEAAALHGLLGNAPDDQPFLIFTDCLSLMDNLSKWGRLDFWPDQEDLRHFDILESCIRRLRCRQAETRIVKVKSHSGLLMNDRADALAEDGRHSDDPPCWPGPRKPSPLCLRARSVVRAASGYFPDDNVADKTLIEHAVDWVEQTVARSKSTAFSCDFLSDPENCGTILRYVHSMRTSTVRLWMQAAGGVYPTLSRLHRITPQKHPTALCQRCTMRAQETLSHFLTVCPQYRAARTEAHNRSWSGVMRLIKRNLDPAWRIYHDQSMRCTQLVLGRPSVLGNAASGANQHDGDLSNWRPDAVAVNEARRKIALLEHCRPFDGAERGTASFTHALDDSTTDGSGGGEDREALGAGHDSEAVPSVRGELPNQPDPRESNRRRMAEAAERKRMKYQPLVAALQHYVDRGWEVVVLPWVAGVRGIVDKQGITSALEFLEIPEQQWSPILRQTAIESVQALELMHSVRNTPNSGIRFEPSPRTGGQQKRRRGWGSRL